MPRYERDDQFWEIERDGKRLRIRSGRIGEPGDQRILTAVDDEAAIVEYDEREKLKCEEGFRPIDQVDEELGQIDPQFAEAVINALDPDRLATPEGIEAMRAAWSVLGDWLASRGDVRGELISIDETLAYVDGPGRNRLLGRRDQLLDKWIPRWFGKYGKLDGPDRPIHMAWDHGFIAAARIGTLPGRLDLSRWRLGLSDLIPVLETLLSHPMMLLIQQLRIGELDPRSRRDLARVLASLRATRRPALLRLELGGISRGRWVRDETGNMRQHEALARIGSLAHLATASEWAPRLGALRIVGRELRVFPRLPQLRVLELQVPVFDEELRGWLLEPWPQLERLWLRSVNLKDPWAGGEGAELDDLLEHLFSHAPLRELGLQGPTALDRLVWRAVMAPLRLDELRLFCLDDASVDTLLQADAYFDGVQRLVLEDTGIGRRWHELQDRFGAKLQRCDHTFGVIGEQTGNDLRESLFDAPGFS